MLKREKYIDGVIGPQSYHRINEIIINIENKRKQKNFTEFEVIEKFDVLNNIKNSNSKISSFLTIQEGCDKFCKFCVVPYTRGPEYSRSFDEVINEAKQIVENGVKEITLLGQNVNAYKNKKNLIKFSSDFIIAYPGESEEDFNDTIKLMKKIKFINSYSFIYSPRPGTPAAKQSIIESSIAKKRLNIFQELANKIKKDYRQTLLSTKVKVLFENKLKDVDKYFGRDEYANSVIVTSKSDLTGKVLNVLVESFNHNTLFGKIITEEDRKELVA